MTAAQPHTTTRAAAGMAAAAAISRGLGFVRVLVVAAVLGTTYLGNAFQAANSLSTVLFELLAAGALSAVLVPRFVALFDDGDDEEAERLAGGVLGAALVVLGAVTVVGVALAPVLAHLVTLGVPDAVVDDQRRLVAYLLRFFVPQVLLYAGGTVAIAVLHAKRRFAVTAAAPIGNTVVMVASLVAFHLVAGPDTGLDLTQGERLLLVLAGTGGVAAFVTTLVVACRLSGFRLRPRWPTGDADLRRLLAHAGWGVVLHTGSGLLLGGALVAGAAVAGGVVAYQVGWVFFLAPYAVLAQPLHTAILPELVGEFRRDGMDVFASSLRWALERMALVSLPVTAGMIAVALPAMRGIAFGETEGAGVGLLAAAVASLAVGLYPYGAFLLLARGSYVLDDSRTPGLVAVGAAVGGVVVMGIGALVTDGAARVAMLGFGHTAAYTVGAVVLGVRLARKSRSPLWPRGLGRVLVVTVTVGVAGWAAVQAVLPSDPSRFADLAATVAVAAVGAALVTGGYRVLGLRSLLTARAPLAGAGTAGPTT